MARAHNFTRKQRAEISLRAGGCCEKCGAKLKAGEGDADHVLPVELGGESEVSNGQWLCKVCHKGKTATDVRAIRKSDRQRDKFRGVVKPKSVLTNQRFKRLMNGTVVDRRTGEIVGGRQQ